MNKIWLVGLPVAAAIVAGALAAPPRREVTVDDGANSKDSAKVAASQKTTSQEMGQETVSLALSAGEQPSTVVGVEADSTASGDRMAHPPIRQTFVAEPYQLVIYAEDSWDSPLADAVLSQGDDILWEQDLPHQYGPKFVLISPQGNVLLLDEFINVASPHALTLINTSGTVVAQHGFKDIEQTLQVSAADLTKQATTGWWISAPPVLSEGGDHAIVAAGGTQLEINLTTGELSHLARPVSLSAI